MTSTSSHVRASLGAARSARDQLRLIDEGATSAGRAYSPAEVAKVAELRGQITQAEKQADAMLEQAERSGAHFDDLEPMLDAINGGERSEPGARVLGGITPIRFGADQLHELHAAYNEHRAESITALESRAVTGVAMAAVSGQRLSPEAKRREPLRVASLMAMEPTESRLVTFYRATTGADAAAPVAEGAAKPESTPGWTAVPAPVRKLAHYADVSTEALADYTSFEQVVRDELTSGLINIENTQVLAGSGAGEDILGLLNQSGIQTYLPVAAEARFVTITHALTLLRTGASFTEGDTVLLSPADWEALALTTDSQGRLMFGSGGPAEALNWPEVKVTTGLSAGTALIGNLAEAAVVFEREAARILVDPYSRSADNMVRFICEERLTVGAIRPASIVKATFVTV